MHVDVFFLCVGMPKFMYAFLGFYFNVYIIIFVCDSVYTLRESIVIEVIYVIIWPRVFFIYGECVKPM